MSSDFVVFMIQWNKKSRTEPVPSVEEIQQKIGEQLVGAYIMNYKKEVHICLHLKSAHSEDKIRPVFNINGLSIEGVEIQSPLSTDNGLLKYVKTPLQHTCLLMVEAGYLGSMKEFSSFVAKDSPTIFGNMRPKGAPAS